MVQQEQTITLLSHRILIGASKQTNTCADVEVVE
jgi:hypothetical protein